MARFQDMKKRIRDRQAFRAAEEAAKKNKENKERIMAFVSALKDSANELSTMPDLLQEIDAAVDQISKQSLSNAQPISHKKKCK